MSQAIKQSRAGSQGGVPIGRNVPQGDPGLFGNIFGAIKGAVRTGVGFVTGGPIGAARVVSRMLPRPGTGFAGPPPPSRGGFGGPALVPSGAGEVLKGYHMNSSSYFLRDGTFIPKGTRAVKNRRRNPANARATSRAISRINGAKRMQSTLAQIETAKFTKGGKKKHHH